MSKRGLFILMLGSVMGASAQNNGLVLHYPFNGNASEVIDGQLHATVNGAVLTSDRFGNANSAYLFDGSNDYLEIADDDIFDFGQEMSISLWFNQDSAAHQGYRLVDKTPVGHFGTFLMDTYGTQSVPWGQGTGRQMRMIANKDIFSGDNMHALNVWHHAVITYDKGAMAIYLDGVEVASGNDDENSLLANDLPVKIGVDQDMGTGWHHTWFKGMMDDLRFYNRALSQEEIVQLFSGNATGTIEKDANEPLVYPNPSVTGGFTLKGLQESCTATIYDMSGKKITELLLNSAEAGTDIDLSSFLPGVYVLRIHTDLRQQDIKLVKTE